MEYFLSFLQQFAKPWLIFIAEDPALRIVQGAMLLSGIVVIFLVFYTTRDILLRTHSFFYMFFSIVLVALLPIVGFFLYLLIRPARTIKEREVEHMLLQLTDGPPSRSVVSVPTTKPAPKKKKSTKAKEDITL